MTDETTGLRERIDGWLDGLPQPGAQPFVRDAIVAGDRIRRRRRQGTVLAVAAAVLALGVGGALLRGTAAPGPAPSPGGPSPSASSSGRPGTVRYPDGTVTWPAPGAATSWVLPDVVRQGGSSVGPALLDAVLAAAPGTLPIDGGAKDTVPGSGTSEFGPGARTTEVQARLVDRDGPRLGLLTVRMTRGGVPDYPSAGVLDPCGTWPGGNRGLGLLDAERDAYFTNISTQTCSLHRSGGSTFVRWEGSGRTPDVPGHTFTTRAVFTVRPDGTAVHVASTTRVGTGPGLPRPRDWADLERLAAGLPVPAGLGG